MDFVLQNPERFCGSGLVLFRQEVDLSPVAITGQEKGFKTRGAASARAP